MKKRTVKLISVLLILIFMLSFAVIPSTAASYIVDGDWRYEMTPANDCYYIAGYLGNDTRVTVPALYNGKPVVKIGSSAFFNNSELLYVNFPATIKEIGDNAFYGCTALKTLQISEYIEKIGINAFAGCTSLSSVTVNAGSPLKDIPANIFYGCTKLSTVTFPQGIETIGSYAFNGCESLMSVIVPASVTSIDKTAFYNTPKLTIYGWDDTYAESYATDMEIPFFSFGIYVEPTTPAPTTAPVTTVAPTTVPVVTTSPVVTDPVEPSTPATTTAPVVTDPVEPSTPATTTAPAVTDPAETTAPVTLPSTEKPVDYVTVYFTNNQKWSEVSVYFWGSSAEGVQWPGALAQFVRTNVYGDDIYSAVVPADADGIIFNDGAEENVQQTADIKEFSDNMGFYPTHLNENGKWGIGTYEYSDTDPEVTTTTPVATLSTAPIETATVIPTSAVPATSGVFETEVTIPSSPIVTLPHFTDPIRTEPTTTLPETKPGTEYLIGDADLDGKVTVKDATLVQKYVANMLTLNNIQKVLANCDGSGGINVKDATLIQKYVANFPKTDPVGQKVYI